MGTSLLIPNHPIRKGEWSASRPGRFTSGRSSLPLNRKFRRPQSWSGSYRIEINRFPRPGIKPRLLGHPARSPVTTLTTLSRDPSEQKYKRILQNFETARCTGCIIHQNHDLHTGVNIDFAQQKTPPPETRRPVQWEFWAQIRQQHGNQWKCSTVPGTFTETRNAGLSGSIHYEVYKWAEPRPRRLSVLKGSWLMNSIWTGRAEDQTCDARTR